MKATLRLRAVSRLFGTTKALDNLDLEVDGGASIGLLGANGSGRTTLLHVAAALLAPTSGIVEVGGVDAVRSPFAARAHVMFVGGHLPAGSGLRVGDYLEFVRAARAKHTRPLVNTTLPEVLERAELAADADVELLSAGLRKRLALSAALLVSPSLLLLDDPFTALDPMTRERFAAWIAEYRAAGTTVVSALNSDVEAQLICDRVVWLAQGRIVARPAAAMASRSLAYAAGNR